MEKGNNEAGKRNEALRETVLRISGSAVQKCMRCGKSASASIFPGMAAAVIWLPFCLRSATRRTASITLAGSTPRGHRSTHAKHVRH